MINIASTWAGRVRAIGVTLLIIATTGSSEPPVSSSTDAGETILNIRSTQGPDTTSTLSVTYSFQHAGERIRLTKPTRWAGASDLDVYVGFVSALRGQLAADNGSDLQIRTDNAGDAVIRFLIKAVPFDKAQWFGQPLAGHGWSFAFGPTILSKMEGRPLVSVRTVLPRETFSNLPPTASAIRTYGRRIDPVEAFYMAGPDVVFDHAGNRSFGVIAAYLSSSGMLLKTFVAAAASMFADIAHQFHVHRINSFKIAAVPFGLSGGGRRFQGAALQELSSGAGQQLCLLYQCPAYRGDK